MIFIFLSVLQSTLIFIAFKLFDRYGIDNWEAISINYLVASAFGLSISCAGGSAHLIFQESWSVVAILLGSLFIGTFYFFALSSQKVGVALTSVSSKMSVVIPVMFGIILYDEKLMPLRTLGIIAALAAFYLTFRKSRVPKFDRRWMFLPVMVFIGNGFVDSTMKFATNRYIQDNIVQFLTMVFLTSLVIGSVIFMHRLARRKSSVNARSIAGGIILGLLNFGSTFYILKAMGLFESSVVFPVANASIVGLSALAGYFGFREPLSRSNWTGVLLAIIAIFIIAYAR